MDFEYQYETFRPSPAAYRRDRLAWPALYDELAWLVSIAMVEKSQVPPSAGQLA